MAGSAEHPARVRHQRKNMAWLNQVRRFCIAGNSSLDSSRTVGGRDTRRYAFSRFNGKGELGAKTRCILLHHQRQAKLFATMARHRHANQPTTEAGHEVDSLWRTVLCGHHQVTFVFPVLIVHQDNHLALTDIVDNVFNAIQCHTVFASCWSVRPSVGAGSHEFSNRYPGARINRWSSPS